MTRRTLIIAVLVLVNLVSAVAVVKVKHMSRELQHDVQLLRVRQDDLKVKWTQLRLEEATWANYDRVRHLARTQFDMFVPKHYIVLGEDS